MQLTDSNCFDFPSSSNYVYTLNEATDDQSSFIPPEAISQADNQKYASDGLSATCIGFCCPICHCLFNSSDQMSRHLNIHNTGKPYVCSHCNSSFNQAENLYVHISLHHTICENQDHYSCCLCDKQFTRFTAYKSHLLLHQVDENFVCSVCEQSFESVSLYEKHFHICTNTTVISKTPSQYRCRVCGMLLSSVGKIKQHYRRRHPCYRPHSTVVTETNVQPSVDVSAENIRISKLRAADYLSTVLKGDRRQGKNSHPMLDQFIYQIPDEEPIIQNSSDATKSKHKKRKAPYLCSVCHKKFVKPSLLKRHMTIHTKNKSYECVLCHARFTQKSSAKTHVLLHISSLNLHPSYRSTENGIESSLPVMAINSGLQENAANTFHGLDSHTTLHVDSGIEILTFPDQNDTLNCTALPNNPVILQSFIPQYHATGNNLDEIRTDHLDPNLIPSVPTSNLEINYSYPQMFGCPVCYKTFRLSRSLAVHMLRHSVVDCKSYERTPGTEDSIKRKRRRNRWTTKIYDKSKNSCSRKLLHKFNRCIHCFKVFRSVNRLKLHIYKTHHGSCTIFLCRRCPRRFISSLGLKRHMNLRHRCVKGNNICPICQTLFLNLSALKSHMNIHSSERLFSCYICHKRFQFLHSCRQHVLNHSIIKCNKKRIHNVRKMSESCTTDIVKVPKYPILRTVIMDRSSKSKDASSCSDPNITVGDFTNTVAKLSLYNNTEPNTFSSVVVHGRLPSNNLNDVFVPLPKSVSHHQTLDFPTVINFGNNFENSESTSVVTKPFSQSSQHQSALWINSSDQNQPYCIPNIPSNNVVDQALDLLVIDASQTFNSTEVPIEDSLDPYQEPVLLAPDNVESPKLSSNLNINSLLNTQSFMCTVEPLEDNRASTICFTSSAYTTNINTAISVINDFNQVGNASPVHETPQPPEKTCLTVHNSCSFENTTSGIINSSSFPMLSTQQLYGCGLCNMVYGDAESLLQHNRISHSYVPKSFSCSECPRSFTNPTLLLSHSRIHSSEYDGILNCPLCPMSVFTKQSALSRHIIYCHPLPLSEPFMCTNCGMRFMMLRCLKSHVNNILNGVDICVSKSSVEQQESNNIVISNELQNDENATQLNKTSNLKRNTHHVSSLSSKLVDEIAKLQPSNHLSLSEKYLIKAARERVEKTVSFPKNSIDSHSLNNNQSSFPLSGNMCNICHKNFTRKSDLRYHLNIHSGIRPYECDKCHRRFMKHSQLRQHKFQVHELNIPKQLITSKKKALMKHALICHLCGSGFSSRSSLRLHVKLHTGTRGYGCSNCNAVFHNPSHRKRHLLKCKANLPRNNELATSNFSSALHQNISEHDVMSISNLQEGNNYELNKVYHSLKDCICDSGVSEHCTKCTLYLDILLYSEETPTNDEMLKNHILNLPNNINNSGPEPVNMSIVYPEITNHGVNNQDNLVNPEQSFVNHNISNTIDIANGQQCQYLLDSACDVNELNQHFITNNNHLGDTINIHDSNQDINNNTNPLVLYSDENIFGFVPCTDIYCNDTSYNNPEHLNAALENEPMNSSMNTIQPLNTNTTDNVNISSQIHDDNNNLTTCLTKNTTIIKAKSNVKYSQNKKFQRLFNCPTCHRTFTKRSSLTRHERIHSMIKPFVCRFCGASFTQSFSLTSHELIHIGEKPYKCSQCNASFRQSCNLKRHLKLVHK